VVFNLKPQPVSSSPAIAGLLDVALAAQTARRCTGNHLNCRSKKVSGFARKLT